MGLVEENKIAWINRIDMTRERRWEILRNALLVGRAIIEDPLAARGAL